MSNGTGRVATWALAVWLAAAGLPASAASAQGWGAQGWGDAEAGRDLAERWCASCHMVAPDQPLASADAPTFMEIAQAVGDDFAVIEGFLIDPHPPMPDLSLTRQEIRNIIAYFATLR